MKLFIQVEVSKRRRDVRENSRARWIKDGNNEHIKLKPVAHRLQSAFLVSFESDSVGNVS